MRLPARAPGWGRFAIRRARLAALLLCAALGAALLPVVPAAAAPPAPPAPPACDPVRTPPEPAGQVPTAEEVIGISLGERDVTVAESDTYLQAVAAASPRVTAGTAAVSWQGRPLRYAIVGKPGNVTPAGLARIRLQTGSCVLGPAPAAPAEAAGTAARAGQVAEAKAAAGRLSDLERPLRVTVAAAGAAETERLLRGFGAHFETRRSGGQVRFLVANPRGLAADEHPFAAELARRLRDQRVPVRAFSLR